LLQPCGRRALLLTLVLLFGFPGEQILRQPLVMAHCVAGPSALIGASNFFELAVGAAISLLGFESGAALATVVSVLIEVPVMLSVVKIVNGTRGWYERGGARVGT